MKRIWMRGIEMSNLALDLKHVFRRFDSTLLICAVLLAIVEGITVTSFLCLDAVVLNPISGVSRSESLNYLVPKDQSNNTRAFSYKTFKQLADREYGAVADIGAFNYSSVTLGNGTASGRRWVTYVSGNLLQMVGVQASAGRLITREDEANRSSVIVLDYEYWRSLGSPLSLDGSARILVNGVPFTVVGVLGRTFMGPLAGMRASGYLPVTSVASVEGTLTRIENPNSRWLLAMARLRPGMRAEAARQQLSAAWLQAGAASGEENWKSLRLNFVNLRNISIGAQAVMGPVLLAVLLLQICVLAVVCINVAAMLSMRSRARRTQQAMMLALGARVRDISMPLVMEALLLATLSAIGGILISVPCISAMNALLPEIGMPLHVRGDISLSVILFQICGVALIAFLLSAYPAWEVHRLNPVQLLRAPGGESPRGGRVGRMVPAVYLGTQTAVIAVIVVVAVFLLIAVRKVEAVDLGFEPEGVRLLNVDLPASSFNAEKGLVFRSNALQRVSQIPGVQSAAWATFCPLSFVGQERLSFRMNQGDDALPENPKSTWLNRVTGSYFDLMKIRIVLGRGFTDEDRPTTARVAVVNQEFLKRFATQPVQLPFVVWSSGDPIRIVGVTTNARTHSLTGTAEPLMYLPLQQTHQATATLHFRTGGSGLDRRVEDEVYRVLQSTNPMSQISWPRPLTSHVMQAMLPMRVASIMATGAGSIGLACALIGLAASIAHIAISRRREIGIRLALGEETWRLYLRVLFTPLTSVAVGLAGGLAFGLVVRKIVQGLLPGMPELETITLLGTTGGMLLVAGLAAWGSVHRWMISDPLAVLRQS